MKQFLIDGGTLRVSPGVALRLTEAQINARSHALEGVEDVSQRDGRAACKSKQPLEFKSGETIGIAEADIAKPFRVFVMEVDAAGKPSALKGKAKPDPTAAAVAEAKA